MMLLVLVFAVSSLAEARIKKVGRRYNVIDFYGGYAMPHGKYGGMGGIQFVDQWDRPVKFGADQWLDDTYFLGFDYGTLRGGHRLVTVGFRFTDHRVMDVFSNLHAQDITYRQYDLEFNANYMFNDLGSSVWTPYLGAGAQAGFTSFSIKGADNDESQLKFALSVNFGIDFKVWAEPQKRSFLTLSSINNFNFLGSDNRPIYLNIGGGLKYYFRP